MDFNAALYNVQQAAMINIRLSQLPRLQRQPEVITNFEPGDLVLRDPRTNTGAARLLTNQLEPLRHRPYLVVEQERHGADITNTVVVRELNNLAKTHRFHHDTLSIFVGTIEQAQCLAQLDNLEFKIIQILSVTGNTSIRTDITFHVRLEDGTLTNMPYGAARFTEAFRIFCAQFVFGRLLSLTREELTQFTHESKPVGPTTAKQLLDLAGEEHRLETRDCRYLTAHWFNSENYSILGTELILPIEIRNREPLFLVRVKKIHTQQSGFLHSNTLGQDCAYNERLRDFTDASTDYAEYVQRTRSLGKILLNIDS